MQPPSDGLREWPSSQGFAECFDMHGIRMASAAHSPTPLKAACTRGDSAATRDAQGRSQGGPAAFCATSWETALCDARRGEQWQSGTAPSVCARSCPRRSASASARHGAASQGPLLYQDQLEFETHSPQCHALEWRTEPFNLRTMPRSVTVSVSVRNRCQEGPGTCELEHDSLTVLLEGNKGSR